MYEKRQFNVIFLVQFNLLACCFNQASTVEKMMKNLRLEITQLRKALEESRYFISGSVVVGL